MTTLSNDILNELPEAVRELPMLPVADAADFSLLSIDYVDGRSQSGKAIRYTVPVGAGGLSDSVSWLPASQCSLVLDGAFIRIAIPNWLARKNNF